MSEQSHIEHSSQELLERLRAVPGSAGACVVDGARGEVVAQIHSSQPGTREQLFDIAERLAGSLSRVGAEQPVLEVMLATTHYLQFAQLSTNNRATFVLLVLERAGANPAMARIELGKVAAAL